MEKLIETKERVKKQKERPPSKGNTVVADHFQINSGLVYATDRKASTLTHHFSMILKGKKMDKCESRWEVERRKRKRKGETREDRSTTLH